jgi:hypothetical protein
MATYKWASNAYVKGDAQKVGEALDDLQADNGQRLTPRVVVDAARPIESPLHPCFEWDDLRAAELFREEQARTVVRSIRVVQTVDNVASQRRVFVNVIENIDGEDQHGYVTLARVMASEDLRQQLIVQARVEMMAFRKRYSELSELAAISDAAIARIDSLLPEPQPVSVEV